MLFLSSKVVVIIVIPVVTVLLNLLVLYLLGYLRKREYREVEAEVLESNTTQTSIHISYFISGKYMIADIYINGERTRQVKATIADQDRILKGLKEYLRIYHDIVPETLHVKTTKHNL